MRVRVDATARGAANGACELSWIVRLAHRWRSECWVRATIGGLDSDVKSILSTYPIENGYGSPPAALIAGRSCEPAHGGGVTAFGDRTRGPARKQRRRPRNAALVAAQHGGRGRGAAYTAASAGRGGRRL